MPLRLQGLVFSAQDPFRLKFIVDPGSKSQDDPNALKQQIEQQVRYFLAALTLPEESLWVNLSFYEKDRIIPADFGATEMGRDLLEQDYQLKQLTASLINPDTATGKKYWDNQGVAFSSNVLAKVWIAPLHAKIHERGDAVVITDSRLQVMFEQDPGAANSERQAPIPSDNATAAFRSHILPQIEKQVNEAETFANLRQIYQAFILAQWFKQTLKESILGRAYVDQKKIAGIDLADKDDQQQIYEDYLNAFKQGAFSVIKEQEDPVSAEIVPRKYFSGGAQLTRMTGGQLVRASQAVSLDPRSFSVEVDLRQAGPKTSAASAVIARGEQFYTILDKFRASIDKAREGRKSSVIHVAPEGNPKKGGEGVYVQGLAESLANRDNATFVINPFYRNQHLGKNQEIFTDAGIYLFTSQVPLGRSSIPVEFFHHEVNGVHYITFRPADELQDILYPEVYPQQLIAGVNYSDSLYGYVEAILLGLAPYYFLQAMGLSVDSLHFNDWQAGLGPVYLDGPNGFRSQTGFSALLKETRSLAISHNMAYNGRFPGTLRVAPDDPLAKYLKDRGIVAADRFSESDGVLNVTVFDRYRDWNDDGSAKLLINLPGSLLVKTEGGGEFFGGDHQTAYFGQHSLLKLMIEFTDKLATVSEGYMQTITNGGGFGLGGVIFRRQDQVRQETGEEFLVAVHNGGSYAAHDPSRIPELTESVAPGVSFEPYRYDQSGMIISRRKNRKAIITKLNDMSLQSQTGDRKVFGEIASDYDANDAFVFSVGRWVRQKGYHILFEEITVDGRTAPLIDHILSHRGGKGERFRLVLGGQPGDEFGRDLSARLRALVDSGRYTGQLLVIERNVEFKLVNQIRSAFDSFFMPSEYEPGGIANIEAGWLGAVFVGSYTGGLQDYVTKLLSSVNQRLRSLKKRTLPDDPKKYPFIAPAASYEDTPEARESRQIAALKYYDIFLEQMRMKNQDKVQWRALVRGHMQYAGDWSNIAPEYEAIYRDLQKPAMQAGEVVAAASTVTEEQSVGGIKFTPGLLDLQIRRDKSGAPLPVDDQPAVIFDVPGLVPVIINIQPATLQNLPFVFTSKTDEEVPALSMN